ncbi:radical SAM/SPASM domain-containing protein [Horticoccus sp. 23ND18S-11]|uniref:radical SAM/SPASM domain-containing protein n=1 Tax=Horticoccus sp. 23ND18S-11 TaxID=3391832 RepID=UPI0039C8C67E
MSAPTRTCLFYDPIKVGRVDMLLGWAEREGLDARAATGVKLALGWRRLAPRFDLGLFIQHPIDGEEDLQTLDRFLAAARATRGLLYYAPRPNHYQHAEAATLLAASPMSATQPAFGVQLRSRIRQAVAALQLPTALKSGLRGLAVTAKSWALRESTSVAVTTTDNQLRPSLPPNLLLWAGAWTPWEADNLTLRRDLLDRIDRFFPTPRHLHVIVLNKCNLRCVMCPYHSPRYTPQHTSGYFDSRKAMDDELYRKIITYAGEHKISLQFGQIEEVLLHPHIFDYIALAKAAGVPHVHVTTNGTMLDAAKGKRLAESGVDSVMFSIDAATAETYRKVRGRDLEELEANITAFLPHAKRHKIPVTVSFILQDEARHERDAFLEKWRRVGVDNVTFYVLSAFDPKTGEVMRQAAVYEPGSRYPCASPWSQSVIFPDGEVSLCCKTMLDVGWRGVVSVGSLREHSMHEIWQGDAYRRLRSELIKNEFREFEVCKKCGIWSASSYFEERTATYSRSYNETSDTIRFIAQG